MNPAAILSLISAAVSAATSVIPAIPTLVTEGEQMVTAGKKVVTDIKSLDANATLADIMNLFADAQLDVPSITAVVHALPKIST